MTLKHCPIWLSHVNFNSHAHVERDAVVISQFRNVKFQLTRSRGAWPATTLWSNATNAISTHTLTWSVTKSVCQLWNNNVISTHTLTWSVTDYMRYHIIVERFQLTRSRGAWPSTFTILVKIRYFNSHAHVERDKLLMIDIIQISHFNSHAHVERDPMNLQDAQNAGYISTHTLTWSVTQLWTVFWKNTMISTHTLTWSVTY